MSSTWECIVWDGDRWCRFPDCVFETDNEALQAASRMAQQIATYVIKTSELDARGLPTDPPAAPGWGRSY